jgi:RNA polymerase sigma factor (sigma-70 family)
MSLADNMATAVEADDVQLIALSLQGNRDAFGEIVARYQTLICSLAYSACGDIHLSEELAQETFVTAWRKLRSLREPAKFKSWLCGIARNLSHNTLRRQGRAPTISAEELIDEPLSLAASPQEDAISHEEEKLLWRAVQELPANYREPMVLFYRGDESVGAVAEALEISEDAVKQRLSRGRVMVTEHIERALRATLRNSVPGKAFTLGVMMALPALTISAKAAVLGAPAAKGGTGAKAAAATGWLGAILSPILILLGYYSGYRVGIDQAQLKSERKFIRSFYLKLTGFIAAFYLSFGLLLWWFSTNERHQLVFYSDALIGLGIVYTLAIFALAFWTWRESRALFVRIATGKVALHSRKAGEEYRSRTTLLGLPLIHVRLFHRLPGEGPVKGWIAVGDQAFGGLVAFGKMAVAPISVGFVAVGLFSWGLMSIGGLAVGGFSIALWSFGGFAVGWQAWGGCAIAWNLAAGTAAVAHDFALGTVAQALQANNRIARQALESSSSFPILLTIYRHFVLLNSIWVLPLFFWWRAVGRRARS